MTKYDPDGGIIWDDEEDYDPDEDENEFDDEYGYLTSDDVKMMDCPMCDGKLSFKYDDNSLYICSLCGYIDNEYCVMEWFNAPFDYRHNEEADRQYRSQRRYWKKQRRERGN